MAGVSRNGSSRSPTKFFLYNRVPFIPVFIDWNSRAGSAAEWKNSQTGRSAKFYSLTRDGRKQLEQELENWKRLSSAVGLLLKCAVSCMSMTLSRFLHICEHRIQALFRREKLDDQLEQELSFHLEQLVQENIQAGMRPDLARVEAGAPRQLRCDQRKSAGTSVA